MGEIFDRDCAWAPESFAHDILTRAPGHFHGRLGHNGKVKAGPPTAPPMLPALILAFITSACGSPNPPIDAAGEGTQAALAADSLDTYVENSRAVWDAARDRGIMFRAVGQEPGWLLEIDSASITLITDYGADTVALPVPQPGRDPASRTTVYRALSEEASVLVTIREESCVDTMSGERFSRAVTAVVNARTLTGCGRQLNASR